MFLNADCTDVEIEELWSASSEAKQRDLQRAIEELDRKFARKLIIDENITPVHLELRHLLRFLRVAVESRDPPLVRKLLEQEPPLNNPTGNEILWVVAEDGDTEIATMLVNAGAELNSINPHDQRRQSLLHVLVASNSQKKHQLAMLMIDHGADVNVEDADNNRPFDYVVAKDDISMEFVEKLICAGAIVDEFIIMGAALSPKLQQLMPILLRGQFNDAVTIKEKVSFALIVLGYMEVDESVIMLTVEALLALAIPDDQLVLFAAVLGGKAKIVDLMLDKGIGTHMVSIMLHFCTGLEHSSVAEVLIKRGADIDYLIECEDLGFANQYPIHCACESGSFPNVKLLLRLGAEINVLNSNRRTPFSLIVDSKLNDVRREMIKYFAIKTSNGHEVNKSDMELIQSDEDFYTFYKSCLDELKEMKDFKLFNHISLHTMLITNVKKSSWLTRNCSLVENYNKAHIRYLFPLYYETVEWKFRNSEQRKKLLLPQETALSETLSAVLPDLVVAKIIHQLYMNNVEEFQYNMNI